MTDMTELQQAIADLGRRVFDTDPDPVAGGVTASFKALKLVEAYAHGGSAGYRAEPLESLVTDVLADLRHLAWAMPGEHTMRQILDALSMIAGADLKSVNDAYHVAQALAGTYGSFMPEEFTQAEIVAFVVDDMRALCDELEFDFGALDDAAGMHYVAEYTAEADA